MMQLEKFIAGSVAAILLASAVPPLANAELSNTVNDAVSMPATSSAKLDCASNLESPTVGKSGSESEVDNRLNHFLNPLESADRSVDGVLLAERIEAGSTPTASSITQVNLISNQILRKETELLKINTRYRIESTRVGRMKPWRLFAFSFAGNTVAEVGISHVAYERWKYWRRPALATKPFLRKGPLCLLVGHSILVGGVLIESSIDAFNDYKLHKNGFDRKACRQRVITLKQEIDELQTSREAACQNVEVAPEQRDALKLEGKVLSDIRDCAVSEFSKFAVRDAKFKTARNTASLITFASAATGGYMGALGNLLAVTNRKPRLALPAGVGFVLSGAFIALTPASTKVASILAGKQASRTENNLLGVNAQCMSNLDADRTALNSLLSHGGEIEGARNRLEIYKMQKDLFDQQAMMARDEARNNNKEFIEKLISNAIVGGTKMGWGTQLIIAGSAYSNTAPGAVPTLPVRLGKTIYKVPIRPMKTPAQLFSRRVAQGATTFIPGPATAAIDALQSRVRGEVREHNARNKGAAAGQLFASRLKTLEEVEAKLR